MYCDAWYGAAPMCFHASISSISVCFWLHLRRAGDGGRRGSRDGRGVPCSQIRMVQPGEALKALSHNVLSICSGPPTSHQASIRFTWRDARGIRFLPLASPSSTRAAGGSIPTWEPHVRSHPFTPPSPISPCLPRSGTKMRQVVNSKHDHDVIVEAFKDQRRPLSILTNEGGG